MAVFHFAAGTAFLAEDFHLDFARAATFDACFQLFSDGRNPIQPHMSFGDPATHATTINTTPTIALGYSSLGGPLTIPPYRQSVPSSYRALTSNFRFYDDAAGNAVLVGTLTGEVYDLSETYTYILAQSQRTRTHDVNTNSGLFMGDDKVTLGGLDDRFYDPQGDLQMHLGGGNDLGMQGLAKQGLGTPNALADLVVM
jgi:hypothetical protein